jgi:hypothetical protein
MMPDKALRFHHHDTGISLPQYTRQRATGGYDDTGSCFSPVGWPSDPHLDQGHMDIRASHLQAFRLQALNGCLEAVAFAA